MREIISNGIPSVSFCCLPAYVFINICSRRTRGIQKVYVLETVKYRTFFANIFLRRTNYPPPLALVKVAGVFRGTAQIPYFFWST